MLHHKANLVNATTLIMLSFWVYYDAINKDFGFVIPMAFGVVLLSLNNGVLYLIKSQIKAAFIITLFALFFTTKMALNQYHHNHMDTALFFGLMSITGAVSSVFLLVKSFELSKKKT